MANLPSPPFITVDGISNFRDVGGTSIYPGIKTATGILFRSADASNATEAGLLKLKELGITHIYDLRSTIEIERDAWQSGRDADFDACFEAFSKVGIKRHWAPVFAEDDYSPEKLALRYKQYARDGSEVCLPFCKYNIFALIGMNALYMNSSHKCHY